MNAGAGLVHVLAAAALAVACGGEATAPSPAPGDAPRAGQSEGAAATEPTGAAERTASIAARTVTRRDTCPAEADCTTVLLEVPAIQGLTPAAATAVSAFFDEWLARQDDVDADPPATDLEAFAAQFIADYRAYADETPGHPTPWSLERRGHLVWQGARVVSVNVTDYAYTGGAHGNALHAFASFDARSGARFELEDLVRDPESEALLAAAEAAFRAQAGIPAGRSLEDAGYWFEAGFQLTDNFAVIEDGLLFYYNAYEIAPYAMGPTELRLARAALGDQVRPDGPLAAP